MTATLRCLNETAAEMLFDACDAIHEDGASIGEVLFAQSANGWLLSMKDCDDELCCYEITEAACCRVIYALTVNADVDVIRESLEQFQVSIDE